MPREVLSAGASVLDATAGGGGDGLGAAEGAAVVAEGRGPPSGGATGAGPDGGGEALCVVGSSAVRVSPSADSTGGAGRGTAGRRGDDASAVPDATAGGEAAGAGARDGAAAVGTPGVPSVVSAGAGSGRGAVDSGSGSVSTDGGRVPDCGDDGSVEDTGGRLGAGSVAGGLARPRSSASRSVESRRSSAARLVGGASRPVPPSGRADSVPIEGRVKSGGSISPGCPRGARAAFGSVSPGSPGGGPKGAVDACGPVRNSGGSGPEGMGSIQGPPSGMSAVAVPSGPRGGCPGSCGSASVWAVTMTMLSSMSSAHHSSMTSGWASAVLATALRAASATADAASGPTFRATAPTMSMLYCRFSGGRSPTIRPTALASFSASAASTGDPRASSIWASASVSSGRWAKPGAQARAAVTRQAQ